MEENSFTFVSKRSFCLIMMIMKHYTHYFCSQILITTEIINKKEIKFQMGDFFLEIRK